MIHGSSAVNSSPGVSGVGSISFAGGIVLADSSLPRSAGDSHSTFGCQTLQEQDQAAHRDQRSADVDDPGIDVVRDQELRDRERQAGDQNGRPDLLHALPAGERPHHPERHDQREDRQLPSDHRAENIGIEAGHRSEALDRGAQRAIGHRRRIGDQRQAGSRERREAEPDQDRAGDRHRACRSPMRPRRTRRTKMRSAAAASGGPAVTPPTARLSASNRPARHRELVHEDDVQHDPADREEAG